MDNEEYEKQASEFHKDTNIWPIGKDMPIGKIPDTEYDVREKAFCYWQKMQKLKASHEKLIEAIKDAEDSVPLTCEFETDARYAWPRRWYLVKEALKEAEQCK